MNTGSRGLSASGRGRAREALATFLLDEGYLDTRPVLAEEEILVRLLATPAAARLPEPLAAESVCRWWTRCQRAAGLLLSRGEPQTGSIFY